MVDRRSAGQAGALARTHGWQQAPAAGLCRCARTVGGTSRPGQQLLPRSVGRRLPLPGQRRAFWQSRRRMVKPATPRKGALRDVRHAEVWSQAFLSLRKETNRATADASEVTRVEVRSETP